MVIHSSWLLRTDLQAAQMGTSWGLGCRWTTLGHWVTRAGPADSSALGEVQYLAV